MIKISNALCKLCTVTAALMLLSGCTEVLSFGVGFGAGFFTGKYYAESDAKDKAAMANAAPQSIQGQPEQQYSSYSQPQQSQPMAYNDPYYGMAPSTYPAYPAAPAPSYAPPPPPAAYPPAYGAAPAYGAPAPVYVPAIPQPAPSSYPMPYGQQPGYGGYGGVNYSVATPNYATY